MMWHVANHQGDMNAAVQSTSYNKWSKDSMILYCGLRSDFC